MQSKLNNYFTDSVAALLAAFTTALLISNFTAAKLAPPHDPLLALPMDIFFWILGSFAMAVVFACIFIRQSRLKLAIILWFALNLIIYRLDWQWQGIHNPRGYFDSLARAFNLSDSSANILSSLVFLYLFTVSACLLVWIFMNRAEEDESEKKAVPFYAQLATPKPGETGGVQSTFVRTLKISCTDCGGHIEFPTNFFGEKIPCPHCQTMITLQKTKNLKMSCAACDGHIEFPDHAVNGKISCPHCKIDITLKESV